MLRTHGNRDRNRSMRAPLMASDVTPLPTHIYVDSVGTDILNYPKGFVITLTLNASSHTVSGSLATSEIISFIDTGNMQSQRNS